MKWTGKNIAIASFIVAVIALGSMWLIPILSNKPLTKMDIKGNKNPAMQDVKTGSGSQLAQANNHSVVNQTTNNYSSLFSVNMVSPDKTKQLVKSQNQTPYPDRPKVIIAGAYVTFINYTDNIQKGLVKAGFNIPFVNIGDIDAKNLTTYWTIIDNGNTITGLDKWLTQFMNQPNYVIQDLPSKTATSIWYNPDIGASGAGTLDLTLDYEYISASTGEKYADQYKGMVYYKAEKNNQPVVLLLTPRK